MISYEDILIRPVLSEKATALRDQNMYVFQVRLDADKIAVKEAVRRLFNVKVVSCTMMNVHGKPRRGRTRAGRTSNWKKAVVRLAPGETIKVFEGV